MHGYMYKTYSESKQKNKEEEIWKEYKERHFKDKKKYKKPNKISILLNT